MNSFRNHRLRDFSVPMSTNWLLNDLAEAKGKQMHTDLERACPGVSRDLIRLRLRALKAAGRSECLGRGPGAKWRKRVISLKEGSKISKQVMKMVIVFRHGKSK